MTDAELVEQQSAPLDPADYWKLKATLLEIVIRFRPNRTAHQFDHFFIQQHFLKNARQAGCTGLYQLWRRLRFNTIFYHSYNGILWHFLTSAISAHE